MTLIVDDQQVNLDVRQLLARQLEVLERLDAKSNLTQPVQLMGDGTQRVRVNDAGELLVSDGPYDLATFKDMDLANTAYNFFGPKGVEQFVITGFLIYGDKDVNNSNDSTVIIYESSQPDSTTVDRILVQAEIAQLSSIPFPNIRLLCNKGVYVNAKTSDEDVHITIFGHYVDLQGRGETNG